MRDPSIHIKASDLKTVLKKMTDLDDKEIKVFIHDLTRLCKPYSVSLRSAIAQTKKDTKRVETVTSSSIADAGLFASLVTAYRRKMKHKGIVNIKAGSKDWLVIKQIVANANSFAEDFNLEKRDAYVKYIEIGFSKMAKFTLFKYIGTHESICNTFEAVSEIEADNEKARTEKIHAYYRKKIAERTGQTDSYANIPEKYVCFVRMKQTIDEFGIADTIYLDAQFKAFEFRDGIPDPLQLVGDKARQRCISYMYEKNISVSKHKKNIDWGKVLDNG